MTIHSLRSQPIGIDLDNTIVSYDALFLKLATESDLIPLGLTSKQAIRDFLRREGRENRWTELQGIAYGSRMDEAVPFAGVADFFQRCNELAVEWRIISHRSQTPYAGEPVDLHAAARRWLMSHRLFDPSQMDRVILEVTRDEKLRRIADSRCMIFIDDLPEMLLDDMFPSGVQRILFDPGNQNPDGAGYHRVTSWTEIMELLGLG